MSSPGVEPGLSRPRRDVLTTRRWGQMPAGELFSHTHIFQTSAVVLGMIDKYMHLGDARVAYWIRRLPPKEEIAGSSPASSTGSLDAKCAECAESGMHSFEMSSLRMCVKPKRPRVSCVVQTVCFCLMDTAPAEKSGGCGFDPRIEYGSF